MAKSNSQEKQAISLHNESNYPKDTNQIILRMRQDLYFNDNMRRSNTWNNKPIAGYVWQAIIRKFCKFIVVSN